MVIHGKEIKRASDSIQPQSQQVIIVNAPQPHSVPQFMQPMPYGGTCLHVNIQQFIYQIIIYLVPSYPQFVPQMGQPVIQQTTTRIA